MVSVSVIISVILAFGIALITLMLGSSSVSKSYTGSISAIQIAEAGVHKALFCMNAASGDKCSGTYGAGFVGESAIAFADGEYTTTVTGGGSVRQLVSVGTAANGRQRTIAVDLTTIPPVDEMDWSYALQAGGGGVYMENGATVTGSIYTGGDVDCQSDLAIIDGDAYSSKTSGSINSCTVNYHAHADKVLGVVVGGDAYYKNDPADVAGSTVAGTKYSGSTTPDEKPLPDFDLEFWQAAAEAGGTINGNYNPADGSSLGPKKITGDLTLGQNVDVTVTGPIWVAGDIYTENNSTLTLDSSFGAYGTVILADHQGDPAAHGRIYMIPNAGIYGSGNPSSHILLVSTNRSVDPVDPALDVSNNASGAVFMATDGVLKLNNNASAKSMAAYALYMENNSDVTYLESELSDMKFSNSPANLWRVQEGSWRETQ